MTKAAIDSMRKYIGATIGPILWSRTSELVNLKKCLEKGNNSEAIACVENLINACVADSGAERINFALDNVQQNLDNIKSKNVGDSIDMLTSISAIKGNEAMKKDLKQFPSAKHKKVTLPHDVLVLYGVERFNSDDVSKYISFVQKYTEIDEQFLNELMVLKYPDLLSPKLPFVVNPLPNTQSSQSAPIIQNSTSSIPNTLYIPNATTAPRYGGYEIPVVVPTIIGNVDNQYCLPPFQQQPIPQQPPPQFGSYAIYCSASPPTPPPPPQQQLPIRPATAGYQETYYPPPQSPPPQQQQPIQQQQRPTTSYTNPYNLRDYAPNVDLSPENPYQQNYV